MTLYYITSRASWESNIDVFHPGFGSHYIELPDGRLLLAANFPDHHWNLDHWESQDGVEPLPHPVYEGTRPLNGKHVAALTHLGIQPGHTVLDVVKAASQIHPLMKMKRV